MRQAVYLVVVATLLTATVVEVVAAGAKTIDPRRHFYTRHPPAASASLCPVV